MQSTIDIKAYWYKNSKHLIDSSQTGLDVFTGQAVYVICTEHTSRVAAVCRSAQTAKSLAVFDSRFFRTIPSGGLTDGKSPVPLSLVWQFKVDGDSWALDRDLTVDDMDRLLLTNQKAVALDTVFEAIEGAQRVTLGRSEWQDAIYTAKYLEAKEVLSGGFELDTDGLFPFVSGYAEVSGLSLPQAASEIKLQHDMACSYLAETETLRVKYKRAICGAQALSDLKPVLDKFNAEFDSYAKL